MNHGLIVASPPALLRAGKTGEAQLLGLRRKACGETIRQRAWGGCRGSQIPSTWISGPRPRGKTAEGSAGKEIGSGSAGAAGLQHGSEAGEYARHARGVPLRQLRNLAARNSSDRDVPEMRIRIALLQAVHVLRSGEPF